MTAKNVLNYNIEIVNKCMHEVELDVHAVYFYYIVTQDR